MKVVRVDDAPPGARVARDVLDLRGTLLYRAGTELSAEVLSQIRHRNISHLFIHDSVPPTAGTAPPTSDAAIDRLFSDVAQLPLMAALREAAKRHARSTNH